MRTCGLASDRFSGRRTPPLLRTPCPLCLFQQAGWDLPAPARCECAPLHTGQVGPTPFAWFDSGTRQSQSEWWWGWKSMTSLLAPVRSGSASKQFSTLVWRSLIGRSWPTALFSAKRIQSPVNLRPDGNSGPPRSWNRSSCGRRCGPLSATASGL